MLILWGSDISSLSEQFEQSKTHIKLSRINNLIEFYDTHQNYHWYLCYKKIGSSVQEIKKGAATEEPGLKLGSGKKRRKVVGLIIWRPLQRNPEGGVVAGRGQYGWAVDETNSIQQCRFGFQIVCQSDGRRPAKCYSTVVGCVEGRRWRWKRLVRVQCSYWIFVLFVHPLLLALWWGPTRPSQIHRRLFHVGGTVVQSKPKWWSDFSCFQLRFS